MATTTPVPNEAPAASGKSSILLPILCSLIGAGAVCGGMIFFLMHSGKLLGGAAAAPTVVVKAEVPMVALTLDPFLVNLADAGSHSYLRTSLVLKVDAPVADKKADKKPEAKGAVDPDAAAKSAALRDTVLTVLSNQTSDALLAAGGKDALKKTLMDQLNKAVPGTKVEEIYFTEFLVQK